MKPLHRADFDAMGKRPAAEAGVKCLLAGDHIVLPSSDPGDRPFYVMHGAPLAPSQPDRGSSRMQHMPDGPWSRESASNGLLRR
jgi:hypothetical protein